jgi:hypothetical protein
MRVDTKGPTRDHHLAMARLVGCLGWREPDVGIARFVPPA